MNAGELPARPLIGLLLRLVYQQYAHDIEAALLDMLATRNHERRLARRGGDGP